MLSKVKPHRVNVLLACVILQLRLPGIWRLPFARLQTPKTPKTFQFLPGSFHQAWPSACAAPGLQPALCLHIPGGSFHQDPGRQRSSIAACPLPAHSPLLLGPSSLPFARLQTPKTPKTPKMPKTLPCLHIALSCYGIRACIRACRLPGFKPLKPLKLSNSFPAASTKTGRQPVLLQGCNLPFACTSLAAASTKILAVSVPALQPALCLHIALSC